MSPAQLRIMLDTTESSVAPFVGLLGTVMGIVAASVVREPMALTTAAGELVDKIEAWGDSDRGAAP